MSKKRLRDLGITPGILPPGPLNAITDVPGVLVGHSTVIRDEPRVARTGITAILPAGGDVRHQHVFAGYHTYNGCGEMTGLVWIQESGLLTSPIVLTDTTQVGAVRDGLIRYALETFGRGAHYLGVVGETWGGWLNDRDAFHLNQPHLFEALGGAGSGLVAEGNVGGGTPMICYDFKGGIGTASRVAGTDSGPYTVGALVQANQGDRQDLRVDGVPVGRLLGFDVVPSPWEEPAQAVEESRVEPGRSGAGTSSSIIGVIATDAPLLPGQCQRLARRGVAGLARTGTAGHSGSGDLFLAFSTGNIYPSEQDEPLQVTMLPHHHLNRLFDAVAEVVEEAILNALVAAETMTGFNGRTAHALPHDRLQAAMGDRQG